MKQYVIDELRPGDYEAIKDYLDTHYSLGGLSGIYWIPLKPEILSDLQSQHRQCQPLYFTLEIHKDRLACELLIRTRERVRCACMGYADEKQRNWLIQHVDAIFKELGIHT